MNSSYIPTDQDTNDALETVQRGANTGGLIGLLAGAGLGWLTHGFVAGQIGIAAEAATLTASATGAASVGAAPIAAGLLAQASALSAGLTSSMFTATGVTLLGLAIPTAVATIGAAVLIGAAAWYLGKTIGKAMGISSANHLLESRGLEAQARSQSPELAQDLAPARAQEQSQALEQSAPGIASNAAQPNAHNADVGTSPEPQMSFLARELDRARDRQHSLAQASQSQSNSR